MSAVRDIAYQLDPALWVREQLGVTPAPWQETFLRAPRGASIAALTARQVGKTTAAAWAMAHTAVFRPNSLSVIACPSLPQSAEAVWRVHGCLQQVGTKFESDNVYGLELKNGSRVLALPGSYDSIRGLTVDGWIVADEAARLTENLIAALRPMRARCPNARFAMLSTAWNRTDPFWTVWAGDNPSWLRLKATVTRSISSRKPFWPRSGARWVKRPSSGSISASRPATKPARSAGSFMSGRPKSTPRWCRRDRRFSRDRRPPPSQSPIRSRTSNVPE